MKEQFRGFYSPKDETTKEIWNNPNTLFIFDANCLLNLYRCEEKTRDDIFSVMDKIADRSWFPFQSCYEYQRNRIKAISDSVKNINSIKKTLTELTEQTANALSKNGVKTHLYLRLAKDLEDFKEKINEPLNTFIENNINPRIEINNSIAKSDFIRTKIDAIVGSKCGVLPSQELINSINEEGESRYKNKTPPGYEDAKKEGHSTYSGVTFTNKFGDLYLWKEIISRAKDDNVKNIVFITDDKKKDWWFFYENNKTKGPLEALQTEIFNETNISNFKLLTQSGLLHEAQTFLTDVSIDESSVEEIKTINYEYNHIKEYDLDDYISEDPSSELASQRLFFVKKTHSNINHDMDSVKNTREFLTSFEGHNPKVIKIDMKRNLNSHTSYKHIKNISYKFFKLIDRYESLKNSISYLPANNDNETDIELYKAMIEYDIKEIQVNYKHLASENKNNDELDPKRMEIAYEIERTINRCNSNINSLENIYLSFIKNNNDDDAEDLIF